MRGYVFQFREVFQELPMLLDGAVTTLHISILTLLFSLIVGTIGALCRMSRLPWIRVPATWYVEVIRNTPLLVQLFFIYFGFSQINIDVTNYTAGLAGLVLNNGAYLPRSSGRASRRSTKDSSRPATPLDSVFRN